MHFHMALSLSLLHVKTVSHGCLRVVTVKVSSELRGVERESGGTDRHTDRYMEKDAETGEIERGSIKGLVG